MSVLFEVLLGVAGVAIWVLSVRLTGKLARERGRSQKAWSWWAVAVGVIAPLTLLLARPNDGVVADAESPVSRTYPWSDKRFAIALAIVLVAIGLGFSGANILVIVALAAIAWVVFPYRGGDIGF